MAGKTFIQRIKILLDGAGKAAKDSKKVETGLQKIQKAAVMAGGSFFAAQGLINGFKHIMTISMETEKVAGSFMNLGKQFGISKSQLTTLRSAVDGTINDLELMTMANQAMSLGVASSADEMANLFDVAQRLGKGLGVDTLQAVQSLVTGMGRQSILMLDNLGIIVDSEKAYKNYAEKMGITNRTLEDQEKKLAFNEEAMRQATEAVANLGEEHLTTSEKIATLTTQLETGFATSGRLFLRQMAKMNDALADLGLSTKAGELNINDLLNAIMDIEEIQTFDVMKNEFSGFMQVIQNSNPIEEIVKFNTLWSDSTGNFVEQQKRRFDATQEYVIAQKESGELTKIETKILYAYIEAMGVWEEKEKQRLLLLSEEEEVKYNANVADERFQKKVEEWAKTNSKLTKEEIKDLKDRFDAENKLITIRKQQIDVAMALGASQKHAGKAAGDAAGIYVVAEVQKALASRLASAFAKPEGGFWMGMAAVATSALVGNLMMQIIQNVGKIKAAEGFEGIVTEPTLILAGEEGPEYVDIEPTMNEGAGRGGVNVSFTGNVLSKDFIEDEAIPMIRSALRKGGDIGIS